MIEPDSLIYQGCQIEQGCRIKRGSVIKQGCIIKPGYEGVTIKGLYKYPVGTYYDFNRNEILIRMGCFHRTIEEWDNDFYNNDKNFPKGALQTIRREFAYKIIKEIALEIGRAHV